MINALKLSKNYASNPSFTPYIGCVTETSAFCVTEEQFAKRAEEYTTIRPTRRMHANGKQRGKTLNMAQEMVQERNVMKTLR